MKLKRIFLWGVIGSLSVAALLGISFVIMERSWSKLNDQMLFSMFSITLFSLTSLVAAVVYEKGHWRKAMIAAWLFSGIGLIVYLAAIWVLFDVLHHDGEEFLARLMGFLALWSVALPHGGLLATIPLQKKFAWVRRSVLFCIGLLAIWISVLILDDGYGIDVSWQCLTILSILVGLGTIVVPVLGKIGKVDKAIGVESTRLAIEIICPRCSCQQTVTTGFSRCQKCKLKFTIEIEEPRCPKCEYLLHQLRQPVCPECGTQLAAEEVAANMT